MTLTCVILAKDAARSLHDAVASIVGYVDKLVICVDSTSVMMPVTLDHRQFVNSDQAPTEIVVAVSHFDEATGFSGVYNGARDLAGGDWQLILDADESMNPEHAANLRELCAIGDRDGVDCWGLDRYNWWDLARTNLRQDWFPDPQWRLLKPHVRFKWRVHSSLDGEKNPRHADRDMCALQHFNLAYRTEGDWKATNVFYDRLLARDVVEGRIP